MYKNRYRVFFICKDRLLEVYIIIYLWRSKKIFILVKYFINDLNMN